MRKLNFVCSIKTTISDEFNHISIFYQRFQFNFAELNAQFDLEGQIRDEISQPAAKPYMHF